MLVARVRRAAVSTTDRAPRKVLLVDDELPVRAFVAKILQREGFEVIEAADGLDALGLFRQMSGAVDVLVTDVRMPRMMGTELVEKVKAELTAMPVVYMSGEPLEDRLHNPSSRVIFLQKPFRPQAMVDAITALIAGYRGCPDGAAPNSRPGRQWDAPAPGPDVLGAPQRVVRS
jgi:DNA-binding response OmpR family regulator